MTGKRKPRRPQVTPEHYDAAIMRIEQLELENAQLLTRYHRIVEKLARLAAVVAGERITSPTKEIRQRGGPSDEELVKQREAEAAQALIAKRIRQREKEDKAFVDKAVAEMVAQGVPRADAEREARRLRDETRTTTTEGEG